jgi:hypothetical protein
MAARDTWRRLVGPKLPLPGTLHLCRRCGGPFTRPVGASPEDAGYWHLELQCGACGDQRGTSVGVGDLRAFYSVVEGQRRRMAQTADELAQERMSAWADVFTSALERDLIDAGDFCGPQQTSP